MRRMLRDVKRVREGEGWVDLPELGVIVEGVYVLGSPVGGDAFGIDEMVDL
jgi:hypothetical protein